MDEYLNFCTWHLEGGISLLSLPRNTNYFETFRPFLPVLLMLGTCNHKCKDSLLATKTFK